MEDILIWVDEKDRMVGSGPKMQTHELARLHRAFSLFLLDSGMEHVLLQKRARDKYHSGGLWSNACCSHPRLGETTEEAVYKRTAYELGMPFGHEYEVKECGQFIYREDYGSLSEHELDHVFFCILDRKCVPLDRFRRDEIEELRWIGTGELEQWMLQQPEAFSAWFPAAWKLVSCALPSEKRDGTEGMGKEQS